MHTHEHNNIISDVVIREDSLADADADADTDVRTCTNVHTGAGSKSYDAMQTIAKTHTSTQEHNSHAPQHNNKKKRDNIQTLTHGMGRVHREGMGVLR